MVGKIQFELIQKRINTQSGDLATSSSELAVARVRKWLAELAVPNSGLAVLLRFAHG